MKFKNTSHSKSITQSAFRVFLEQAYHNSLMLCDLGLVLSNNSSKLKDNYKLTFITGLTKQEKTMDIIPDLTYPVIYEDNNVSNKYIYVDLRPFINQKSIKDKDIMFDAQLMTMEDITPHVSDSVSFNLLLGRAALTYASEQEIMSDEIYAVNNSYIKTFILVLSKIINEKVGLTDEDVINVKYVLFMFYYFSCTNEKKQSSETLLKNFISVVGNIETIPTLIEREVDSFTGVEELVKKLKDYTSNINIRNDNFSYVAFISYFDGMYYDRRLLNSEVIRLALEYPSYWIFICNHSLMSNQKNTISSVMSIGGGRNLKAIKENYASLIKNIITRG